MSGESPICATIQVFLNLNTVRLPRLNFQKSDHMKITLMISQCIVLFFGYIAHAQSTFIYDQQSADESTLLEGSAAIGVAAQSFTPTLSEIGYVRLYLFDSVSGNGGGTLFLSLHGDSPSGPILGTSTPLTVPTLFAGFANFMFANPVTVTPETTYYFTVDVQSGGGFSVNAGPYNYPRGAEYFRGSPIGLDFWFREGIVPEPSSASLLVMGAGFLLRRLRSRK
jgi:hypothetical protein